jgi:hypothetical protein
MLLHAYIYIYIYIYICVCVCVCVHVHFGISIGITMVGAQGNPCSATILWSIVRPHLLYSTSSLIPLRQSTVSYITESHHSYLGP